MNIARVLGDKFLKEQDTRFSSKPFISEVLRITQDSKALAVIARFQNIHEPTFLDSLYISSGLP